MQFSLSLLTLSWKVIYSQVGHSYPIRNNTICLWFVPNHEGFYLRVLCVLWASSLRHLQSLSHQTAEKLQSAFQKFYARDVSLLPTVQWQGLLFHYAHPLPSISKHLKGKTARCLKPIGLCFPPYLPWTSFYGCNICCSVTFLPQSEPAWVKSLQVTNLNKIFPPVF